MPQVLLLNASYEPLAIINQRRALTLLLKGRVEAACQETIEVRSISSCLYVPTVIRLRRYVNVPRRGARWSRKAILQRDKFTCAYCLVQPGAKQRGKVLTRQSFTVDHVIPISRNGKNTWGNTVCACPACNQRKGNRTPHEAQMRLHWEPKTPRVNYLIASGDVPATWKMYIEVDGLI
jgi:5-methylcytosine-specific restriction endonuclease McrA